MARQSPIWSEENKKVIHLPSFRRMAVVGQDGIKPQGPKGQLQELLLVQGQIRQQGMTIILLGMILHRSGEQNAKDLQVAVKGTGLSCDWA